MQNQSTTTGKTTIPAHRNARLNHTMMTGFFKAFREHSASMEHHAELMDAIKRMIRQWDAEPPAWFTGPTRADWVRARLDAGEKMTDEEIGRALMGEVQS